MSDEVCEHGYLISHCDYCSVNAGKEHLGGVGSESLDSREQGLATDRRYPRKLNISPERRAKMERDHKVWETQLRESRERQALDDYEHLPMHSESDLDSARREAIEEAARVAEDFYKPLRYRVNPLRVADAIRALATVNVPAPTGTTT